MFRMRTFGREQGPRLIGRRVFLRGARRSSATVCLVRWDVNALLSGCLFVGPHKSALPFQLLTMVRSRNGGRNFPVAAGEKVPSMRASGIR